MPRPLAYLLAFLVSLAVVTALAFGSGYLAGRSREPSVAGPTGQEAIGVSGASVTGTVQRVESGALTLTTETGSQTIRLPFNPPVEYIKPAARKDLVPGVWLSVGGVRNPVNTWAITGIVIIPLEELASP